MHSDQGALHLGRLENKTEPSEDSGVIAFYCCSVPNPNSSLKVAVWLFIERGTPRDRIDAQHKTRLTTCKSRTTYETRTREKRSTESIPYGNSARSRIDW